MQILKAWTLASVVAVGMASAGCRSEDYYCDRGGCYSCDGLGCRTVDAPSRATCRGDFECPAGTLCTDAGCVSRCASNAECPKGTVCHVELGWCLAPTESEPPVKPGVCVRNTDCPEATLVCRDGVCTRDTESCGELGCSCVSTGKCSDGFVCTGGECRPSSDACHFSYECGPGDWVCADGHCYPACGPSLPRCPVGFACTPKGYCSPAAPPTGQCARSSDCGEGHVCIDSTCYLGCQGDPECGPGRYCKRGVCRNDDRPKPFCTSNDQCEPGHPCVGGVCRTPCDTNATCLRFDVQFNSCMDLSALPGPERYCVSTSERTSDCRVSVDCGASRDCVDGLCR